MINSGIYDLLGRSWCSGKLQYRYLSPDQDTAEAVGYHETGQLYFFYPIKDGKVHGTGRIWYPNGVLQCEETYVLNVLDGPKREWHPNGKPRKESYFKNGVPEGVRKEWYESGVPMMQCFYRAGRLEGEFLEWFGNGHVRRHFNYLAGRRHGVCKCGKPDGTLKWKKIYIQDVVIPPDVYKLIETRQLTANYILGIKNIALRRICLEQLGYSRFLAQMEHQIIDTDGDHDLVKIFWHEHEEEIALVKVRCPSTGAYYTLRVPPFTQTVKQAVAWTFHLSKAEYQPTRET